MKKIIIIDDQPRGGGSVPYWIGHEIEVLTEGEYSAELLEGAIIAEALPLLKRLVQQLRRKRHSVAGLLIDFVDETRGDIQAGAVLLEEVKSDPKLKGVPVVIYTSRQTPGFVPAELKKKGAKDAFRRRVTGGKAGDLGTQTLDAFEIPYRDSRTGSPGPH